MSEITTYIGIDNGVNGGLAAISCHPQGGIIKKMVTPSGFLEGRNRIDPVAVKEWLSLFSPATTFVTVEKPVGSKNLKAAISMEGSYACIRTVLQLMGYSFICISAGTWQKKLLPRFYDDTKNAAMKVAIDLWPCENWLATPRCSVPHDGMIDAALIARYALLERLDLNKEKAEKLERKKKNELWGYSK